MASYRERIYILDDGSQDKDPALRSRFHPKHKVDNDTSFPEIHICMACQGTMNTNMFIATYRNQYSIKVSLKYQQNMHVMMM